MNSISTQLQWINGQEKTLTELLFNWSNINSGSDNLPGLNQMVILLEQSFAKLNGTHKRISLAERTIIDKQGIISLRPAGQALHITKRLEAPFKVFLGGHMDTVFDISHPYQTTQLVSPNVLRGPGSADMKGGLLVMLTALQAFEQHPLAQNIGWEIVINPDEEVGSVSSDSLIRQCARRCHLGLIFEPSFADGYLVAERKGSINLTVIARGRSAHVGRDFDKGRNAIATLANYLVKIENHFNQQKDLTINFGYIYGGITTNIVPDLALCKINVRVNTKEQFLTVPKEFQELATPLNQDGIHLELHTQSARSPKPFDTASQMVFNQLQQCAKEEGYTLYHRNTGGACDGNILAQEGLPVIDTLGVIGGEIHTDQEYVLLDSLVSRSRLVFRYLIQLAEAHQHD